MKLKLICRTFVLIALLVISVFSLKAQDTDKTVTVIASGSGKTQEDAQKNALRGAIEQAFGAFISSKTEILNDNLVSDQITSVANGNIQSFQILNEAQLPNNTWATTVKAVVSVDKLTKFVEAKGVTVEIKGGLFALNIKQQMLNEQGELDAVSNLAGIIHEIMQNAYDYTITAGTPQAKDASNKNWVIPIVVTSKANKNSDFCANYFIRTLTALSLSKEEEENYKTLNKPISNVYIDYVGTTHKFRLRNYYSVLVLKFLKNSWSDYKRLFITQSDLTSINGLELETNSTITNKRIEEKPEFENFRFSYEDYRFDKFGRKQGMNAEHIIFFTEGTITDKYSWSEPFSLEQINQITGYKVRPLGDPSKFSNDGIVFFEKNGHGIVAACIDFDDENWDNAKKKCKELIFKNHTDWRLPTRKELDLIKSTSKSKPQNAFFFKKEVDRYWSDDGFYIGFDDSNYGKISTSMPGYIRFIAVRSF